MHFKILSLYSMLILLILVVVFFKNVGLQGFVVVDY